MSHYRLPLSQSSSFNIDKVISPRKSKDNKISLELE